MASLISKGAGLVRVQLNPVMPSHPISTLACQKVSQPQGISPIIELNLLF